jgi:hypothetical protein
MIAIDEGIMNEVIERCFKNLNCIHLSNDGLYKIYKNEDKRMYMYKSEFELFHLFFNKLRENLKNSMIHRSVRITEHDI